MSRLVLPLAEVPAVIRESARAVLKSHGFAIVRESTLPGTTANRAAHGVLTEAEIEMLLRELGNNAAQALFSIDQSEEG